MSEQLRNGLGATLACHRKHTTRQECDFVARSLTRVHYVCRYLNQCQWWRVIPAVLTVVRQQVQSWGMAAVAESCYALLRPGSSERVNGNSLILSDEL